MTAVPCPTGLERPARLRDETRRFALESMGGKYGDEARANPAVSLDQIENFDALSSDERCALAVEAIGRTPSR